MRITFGGHRSVYVDDNTAYAWFPRLLRMPMVSGHELVSNLEDSIRDRYGIKNSDIQDTLYQLFRGLGKYRGYVEHQTQMGIIQVLCSQLATDARISYYSRGLRGTRHMFVILAYLAVDQESLLLAETLLRFWLQAVQTTQTESRKHQGDWWKAVRKIQEMMEEPATMDFEPFAMVPHTGWHRGRSARALALPWPGHRARSLPAIRRRHSPDMRVAIPAYPSSGWASPIMSPVGYPRGDYFDELQNLQWQQSDMGMKLDSVDGKLDVLLEGIGYGHGYY